MPHARIPVRLATFLALVPIVTQAQEPNFGRAVAMTQHEMVIGQPVNWYGAGTVYSYRLDTTGHYREAGRLVASDSSRMDDFGRAVALDGNTLVVTAPRKANNAGVAYIFTRATATTPWKQSTRIAAPDGGEFGTAAVLVGDELLIGAPATTSGGTVYQYHRSNGTWTVQHVMRPDPASRTTDFGATLAWQGEWLLVGAPASDSGAGRAFVSQRSSAGTWSPPTTLTLPRTMGQGGARLGSSLLLDGAKAYVGASGAMAVYALARDGSGRWDAAGELQAFDGGRRSQFGFSMAKVGNELWVGAPGNGGGVYRFLPNGDDAWQGAMRFEADSGDATSWPFAYGYSIAAHGARAVISMPTRDFGEGRVVVAARSGTGWQRQQILEGEIFAIGGKRTPAAKCSNGKIGAFTCANMELTSHMPISALGGERGVWLNDVWGWTDPLTQKEYVLVARRDGASFVDLSDPANPRLVGTLPRTKGSPPSVWRDIKVIGNYAYIVADGADAHGVQVFDLTRLRTARNAPTFSPDTTYHEIFSAHNIVADTASHFLYVVGSNSGGETCGGGLHMIDASNPIQLKFVGCYNDKAGSNPRGYTHDAQCLIYQGPDTKYRGHQLCIGSNEKEINIADVTDKRAPVTIGRNTYPNVSYAHQGWFDAEQRFFYMNDEGDELDGLVPGTRTIVWDLRDLSDPVVAKMYIGPVRASDHNLFVKGNRVYEANYGSGLRVLDISDRTSPREIAYFDSAPYNDDAPGYSATQSGAWSNYPFFKSGVIVFTSVREGLFVVRVSDLVP